MGLNKQSVPKVGWVLFALLLFSLVYVHQKRFNSATPVSRLDLLHAILTHGTFRIDAYDNTPDKAIFEAHYYSDKAPGTVALALPFFALAAGALSLAGISLESNTGWLVTSWAGCVGSNALVAALGGVALFTWLSRFVQPKWALVTTLAVFLGSMPLPYSTLMFSHALVIGCVAIAIWAIARADSPSWTAAGAGVGAHAAFPFDCGSTKVPGADTPAHLASTSQSGVCPDPSPTALQGASEDSTASWTAAGAGVGAHAAFPLDWGKTNVPGGDTPAHPASTSQSGVGPDPSPTALQGPGGPTEVPGPSGIPRPRQRWDLLAGGACGWALASEYTAGIVVTGLFLWMISTSWRRAIPFCLGALPPLLLIPLYSWACFGNPFTLPYSLQASFPEMQEGLYAIKWPDPETAFNLLFSPARGLFFWSPFLLIAGIGYRSLVDLSRKLFWLTYAIPLLQILVISGRVWDWPAGFSFSARYLAPILPLLALPCALGVQRFPKIGIALALYSVSITVLATLTDICLKASITNPLLELHLPLLRKGEFSPNLGQALGLPPYLAAALFCAVIAAASAWLWRRVSRLPPGIPEPMHRDQLQASK